MGRKSPSQQPEYRRAQGALPENRAKRRAYAKEYVKRPEVAARLEKKRLVKLAASARRQKRKRTKIAERAASKLNLKRTIVVDHVRELARWCALVPAGVAKYQAHDVRNRRIWIGRKMGATLQQIADYCGVTRERVRQIEKKQDRAASKKRPRLAPVENYFRETHDLERLLRGGRETARAGITIAEWSQAVKEMEPALLAMPENVRDYWRRRWEMEWYKKNLRAAKSPLTD